MRECNAQSAVLQKIEKIQRMQYKYARGTALAFNITIEHERHCRQPNKRYIRYNPMILMEEKGGL